MRKSALPAPVVDVDDLNLGPDSPLRKIKRQRAARTNPEHDGQALYFSEVLPSLARRFPRLAPLLSLTYANPQQGQQGGKLGKIWGAYFEAEGKRPGIPDLTHPVARYGYHGLYIENKIGTTPMSENQKRWADLLHEQGYAVVLIRGSDPRDLAEKIGLTILDYTLGGQEDTWHVHSSTTWL